MERSDLAFLMLIFFGSFIFQSPLFLFTLILKILQSDLIVERIAEFTGLTGHEREVSRCS